MKKVSKKENQIKRIYGYEFQYDVKDDFETGKVIQNVLKIPRLLIVTDGKYFGVSVYREDKDDSFTRKRANEIALGRLEKMKMFGGDIVDSESDLQIKNYARTISDVGDFGRLYFWKRGSIPRYGTLKSLLKTSSKVGIVGKTTHRKTKEDKKNKDVKVKVARKKKV